MKDFVIPDYVSPITAYRVWQLDSLGLKSLNNAQWFPGQPFEAKCAVTEQQRARLAATGDSFCEPCEIPGDNCTCGVYAAKSLEHLIEIGYNRYGILGKISLWGKVSIHKLGYRAQFAYPQELTIPVNFIPPSAEQMESRIATLTAYSVDISILTSELVTLPLWTRAAGYGVEATDYLVARTKGGAMLSRTLKVGDRVSIPKHGIGIVDEITAGHCHVQLWGNSVTTVEEKQIKWDETNYRWEASGSVYIRPVTRLVNRCRTGSSA
jgi:hypothetical protein